MRAAPGVVSTVVSVAGLPAGARVALVCGRRAVGVRWLDTLARQRADSRVVRVYRSLGRERIVYANGTAVYLMSCRPDAWHGEAYDLVIAPEGVSEWLLPHVEAATATSVLRDWPPKRPTASSRARAIGNTIVGGLTVALVALPLLAYLAGWFG